MLTRLLRSIGEQLSKLTPTARLLIGASAVIVVMGLLLVSLWASTPSWQEIYQGAEASVKQEAVTLLRAKGIEASLDGQGRLMVSPADGPLARGVLAEGGVLPANGAILFANLTEHMKWTNPREMNQQIVRMALQGELERTIANFPSMRSARVFLDVPEPTGIGMASRSPTASVSVTTADGTPVTQSQVDAVARLVSRAVSGLGLRDISVIDASNSRYMTPRGDDDAVATTYLEHQTKVERQFEQKIRGLLAHIPGVSVAVTAAVDVKRVESREERFLGDGEGTVSALAESQSSSESQRSADRGAEPGVRPNTGADITAVRQAGPELEISDGTERFDTRFGSAVTSTVDPRGMATAVSISVQIPRGYIASLLAPAGGEGEAAAPDEAAVDARFESERERIASLIEPHLPVVAGDEGVRRSGEVVVGLMSVDPPMLLAASGAGAGGGAFGFIAPSGGGAGLGVPLIEQGLLVVLAGVALGMMLLMVRKATRKVEMPTPAELVGIPPALDGLSDVVGEADESQPPMEGIEIDEDQMKSARLLEQVSDLVGERPDLAARLLSRWVDPEH